MALAAASLLLAAILMGLPLVITGTARAAVADSPKVPVVYLLGGSSARDSTGSNRSWAAEVRRLGGTRVRAYNLATSAETYARDITVVNDLPALPSIVLIGVSLGRYTQTPVAVVTGSVDSAAIRSLKRPHHHGPHVLSDTQKRSLVQAWLAARYPLFEKNFAGNAAELDQLITACQARDLHPVLLELPLNLKIVGHAFDKPRITYRDSCRAQAKKYGIPKINLLPKVHLVSSDFYDLVHLVKPGRVKWQLRLSKTVVSLLERYGMDGR